MFAFKFEATSSSVLPVVSSNTKSMKKNPIKQETPQIKKHPCKSIVSNKIGYIFMDINPTKLYKQQIMVNPNIRTYKRQNKTLYCLQKRK